MSKPIIRPILEQVAAARAAIIEISAADAVALAGDPGVVFIDVRDPRELDRDGIIPGAFHCTRGMLEFWIDPASPYHKPVFAADKRFIFYCAIGWRSALATKTAQDMGIASVAHIETGLQGWKAAGGPIETRPPKTDKGQPK